MISISGDRCNPLSDSGVTHICRTPSLTLHIEVRNFDDDLILDFDDTQSRTFVREVDPETLSLLRHTTCSVNPNDYNAEVLAFYCDQNQTSDFAPIPNLGDDLIP